MLVLGEGCLSDDVHPELSLVRTVGVRSNRLSATSVAFVAVAVVLSSFWRLWVGNLFDESGADALRLVKVLAAFRTAVTGDLNFSVRVGSVSEGWVVSRFASGCSTVSASGIVVLVVRGRRITSTRSFLAGWCMRTFVPSKFRSEPFVFVAQLLVCFTKLLVLFVECFVLLTERFVVFTKRFVHSFNLISSLFEGSDPLKQLFYG